MIEIVYQAAFAGLADDQVAGDIVAKCKAMLLEEPETREDYERAWIRYLARYHHLDVEFRQGWIRSVDDLLLWLEQSGAPGFRTVANRCQELIRADAKLQPSAAVMEKRQKQRKQGRIR